MNQVIRDICDWERLSYGEGLHRKPDQLEEWLSKENRGFFCVLSDHDSTLVAYTDIWFVEEAFFQRLKVGLELEEEIPADAFCSLDSPSRYCYVGSIITNPTLRIENPQLAHGGFRAICSIFTEFFSNIDLLPLEIIGVASSSTGARILNMWGFSPVEMHQDAIDRRPRYSRNILSISDSAIFSGKRMTAISAC